MTWRLGILDSLTFEKLILKEGEVAQLFANLHQLTRGVFYLSTCQRIVLIFEIGDEWLIQEAIEQYFNIKQLDRSEETEPEVFLGIEAIDHLSKVISGLDSAVLGEYEIQRQFKEAYENSSKYLSSNLKTYLPYIIRIGKRVRSELQLHKSSTIEAVNTLIENEIENADSIGLIGTGKMGLIIVNYFDHLRGKIRLYSTHEQRTSDRLAGMVILDIEDIQPHDIIFTATSKAKFIDKEFIEDHNLANSKIVVDLGMPRNCDPLIKCHTSIELIDIETLVYHARNKEISSDIGRALEIIEEEKNTILKAYHKQLQSSIIVGLREELTTFANCKKSYLTNEFSEKNFQQFVNSMIHISQKYLEKVIYQE